jgi:putative transcription factor
MINVEGARMSVCAGCARFGTPVAAPAAPKQAPAQGPSGHGLETRQRRMTEKPVPLESDEDLVADFGERVRAARERKRVSLDDLARAVNEKKSLLAKVETGTYFPDPNVTRKLEAALGIKLREKVEEVHTQKYKPTGGMTIGDLIKMKKD